jgi:hypothetical protein
MTIGIGIYSGGDPYTTGVPYKGSSTEQLFNLISTAGYTTVVVWAAHIDSAGDININDSPVVAGGVLNTLAQPWATQVAALKQNKNITRLELSIGGDDSSFANIKSLINQFGTGTKNPLYNNLSVLKNALNLDAVNYDDETEYDPSSSESLATMCVALKMRVSICPFENSSYWVNLVTAINKANAGTVDAVYVQCYDDLSNNPSDWNGYFKDTGLKVAPGLWACHFNGNTPQSCTSWSNAAEVQSKISGWVKQTTLDGGWMFCGTDMQHCPGGGTPAEYAKAISSGLSQAASA